MEKETYHILIVEDSELDRQVYKRYLKKDQDYNYEILEAETGEEALDIVLTDKPDFILIDFLLPDMNGLELIEIIKKIEHYSQIPIIMLTGQGNEEIALQAMKHNISDYLVKGNITNSIFINSIHQIINLKNNEIRNFTNKIITVLIIDNSPQDEQIYRQFLNREEVLNFNIIQVKTGEEAIQISKKIPPNVIILDIQFSNSNDIELINKFKSVLNIKKIPIIVISTGGKQENVVMAMKNGAKDYLFKQNITPKSLYEAIENAIKTTYLENQLLKNKAQQELISKSSLKIRESLNLEEILDISVKEVKNFLNCDRVIIYKFNSNEEGEIIAESINPNYQLMINIKTNDPCFQGEKRNKYLNASYKQIINNISGINLDPCYRNLLAKYQVKSALVLPILLYKNDQLLWGLLIVHYCSENHFWEQSEIFCLQELCVQISIAIKQGLLVQDLKEARKKAEEANILKTAFLANMSHEIRTPMNGILGMTELLGYTKLDNDQKDFVNTIQSSGNSLLNLINDILDLSKLEAKQVELDCHEFNLSQLVKEIYNLLYTQAHNKNLKLTYNLSQNIPNQLLGDSFRLRQIIINLVNNAIKFTSQGEVNLIVEEIKIDLSQYTNLENPICLKFSIKDTGIGIKKEQEEKLFKPFSQVNTSTTHNYGGTGLGLSICKQLVELMNGEIGLESNQEQGSLFWFNIIMDSLLIVNNIENNLQSTNNFSAKSLRENKILVVEDNRTNQTVIKLQMKKLGYTIDIANNGQEALEKLKINSYQLIFMDCQMPILDGYDTTRFIRETEHLKDNIIIGLTAFAMKGDEQKCLDAGMDDYVTKPISLDNLQIILNKWLKN